jgi:hypothetical protein
LFLLVLFTLFLGQIAKALTDKESFKVSAQRTLPTIKWRNKEFSSNKTIIDTYRQRARQVRRRLNAAAPELTMSVALHVGEDKVCPGFVYFRGVLNGSERVMLYHVTSVVLSRL